MTTHYYKTPKEQVCAMCGCTFISSTDRKTCCDECAIDYSVKRRLEKKYEREGKESPLEVFEKAPDKHYLKPDRPVTQDTLWLVEQYYIRDGFTPGQIAKEINREPQQIVQIINEILLPDENFQKRLQEFKRSEKRKAAENGAFAAKKCGKG